MLPEIMKFTAVTSYPIVYRTVGMMFMKGMSISFDDQIMRFVDSEIRLMEAEDGRALRLCEFDARKTRKKVRRNTLRLRIKNLSKIRKI
ncbi:hypothetical protein SAMN05421680_105105 [Xenorhabdus mauleonii]|nr:hypothetical protein SAMN05421680_105105 [Xenorhabdus mauleonii]